MNKLNYIALILLTIGLALLSNLMFKVSELKGQIKARELAEPVRTWSNVVNAPPIPPAPPLTHSRPWVKLPSGDSYFDFSGDEWGALTNAFPDRVQGPAALQFPEGAVYRVNDSRLKAMSNVDTVRTNIVWFFTPVTTNAPTLETP